MAAPNSSESTPCALVARIELAYDGTDFHGWQIQPGRVRTVQGELVAALERLVPLSGLPPGAGRTDAGVHARGQVCSVPLADAALLPRIQRALPHMMPDDVAIRSVAGAPPDFHARFGARGRRYVYRFTTERDPFLRRNHLRIDPRTDVGAMATACEPLMGDHDCTSLCRTASLEPGRTLCRIRRAALHWDGAVGHLEIEADRFLHSMVRIVVGTLLEVGAGRRPVDTFREVLAARDRRTAGGTAPPHGLCLERVDYDEPPPAATEG
ncbi:MAG TPA: tRNA pseudouridine(38-40) synthase TruA [Candidatus Krumholzibacteria bacterium]|nr:tRNA pseudouridine(38-40) synthase TruA [Candidatus Krumholzibacteria bacterium]